jgi:hypothetical protein
MLTKIKEPPDQGKRTYRIPFPPLETVNMSSPSDNFPSASPLNLSPHELSRLMTSELGQQIPGTFNNSKRLHAAVIRHYYYVSLTIDRLEFDLELHRREQENLFDSLMESQTFQTRIRPILQRYRRRTGQTQYHPYARTPTPPRTPSEDYSIDPPLTSSSIRILPEEALARIMTPDCSRPTSSERLGREEIQLTDDQKPEPSQNPFLVPVDSSDEEECQECGGAHQFMECPEEFALDEEMQKYVPCTEDETPFAPLYVSDMG